MKLSPIGEAALIAREGRRLTAYRDSVGIWTIGVGHTSAAGPPKVTPGLAITAAECDAIFARDVERYAETVRRSIKVPIGQHAFDALVSLCYNIGSGGFARSTLVKRINAGAEPQAIREAFLMWRKPAEILSRRRGEADQFGTPYATALPRARDTDARRIVAAAPVAAVLAPETVTPVIVPVSPPAPAMPWRRRLAALLGLTLPPGSMVETAQGVAGRRQEA